MNKVVQTLLIYFLAGVFVLTILDYLVYKNFDPIRNVIAGLLAVTIYYFLAKKSLSKQ